MKTFPMFIKMAERSVVIIGGGEQAAQKARLILKTEARMIIVAPELEPELADLVSSGQVRHAASVAPGDFADAALVFVATGCKGADAAWHARAKAEGALVNVVDYPDLCDAMTPSIVDRDPVVVAIGTEGTAPLLGRQIKTRVEEILHPRLGAFAALAGRLRRDVAHHVPRQNRRNFWRWMFAGAPWQMFSSGQENRAVRELKHAIRGGERAVSGHLCFVHGAASAGLIPMAAVQRLQEADVVYFDEDVAEGVLELARRDAERVRVNVGGTSMASLTRLLARVSEDRNVVHLSVRQTAEVPHLEGVQVACTEVIRCGAYIPSQHQETQATA